MATTETFHFEDPERHHYISSDISSLSEEKQTELDPIIDTIIDQRHRGIIVVVDSVPEGDLELATNVPNVYQLRDGSETARVATYITKHTGYTTSTLQKGGLPDNFVGEQRTPKNHSLVVIFG